ncbi:MAG TPA: YfiR family protein [Planctomycetota bacterium]|nr:YfiR family protein [Planctomycetota bacterium]
MRQRRGRTTALRLAAIVAALAQPLSVDAQDDPPLEYKVKAAFIYNFARFTEWPAEAFEKEDSPLVIGIIGEDPFGEYFDKLIKDKKIANRPVVLRRLKEVAEAGGCHVLFVGNLEKEGVEQLFKKLGDRPVLTVGERPRFAHARGVVNFVIEEEKVRFEINPDRAKQCGLKVSSKVLQLARIVASDRRDKKEKDEDR